MLKSLKGNVECWPLNNVPLQVKVPLFFFSSSGYFHLCFVNCLFLAFLVNLTIARKTLFDNILVSLQVKSGTLFDNVLVSDDLEYAKKLAEETWGKHKDVCGIFFPQAMHKK